MKLSLLTEAAKKKEEKKYHAAVAIVRNRDKWLLGLAKNTGDDRDNKWIHPGGGIKPGETPEKAATREAKEETGVRCRAISGPLEDSQKPDVAFVVCKTNDSKKDCLRPNHEFALLGWFTVREMRALNLYENVRRLIDRAKSF